jgi:2-aminoethylphosphonate dioxygenase
MFGDDERKTMERDGVCVLRGVVSEARAHALSALADVVAKGPDEAGGVMRYLDEAHEARGKTIVGRVEYCRAHVPELRALMVDGPLLAIASGALGAEAIIFKDKINFKTPGGACFEPHQDAQAEWSAFGDFHLTCMLSLDATTIENGCLEVARGEHRRGLLGAIGAPLTAPLSYEAVVTEPGDVVVFGSYLPHRSGPNLTDATRRVLYLTFNTKSAGDHYEGYFAKKRASFPPNWQRSGTQAYRYKI